MAPPRPTIIPGTRYEHLVLTGGYLPGYMDGNKAVGAKVECKCDCGNITHKQLSHLKRGIFKVCNIKCPFRPLSAHGSSMGENGKLSKEYVAWHGMIQRCNNPKNTAYKNYGGRGISVHPEWQNSPTAFLEYIGKAPTLQHSLDRIDNDGNYEPENVRWATKFEQTNNRRTVRKKEEEIAILKQEIATLKQLLHDNNIEYEEAA